ncbi:MAG: hypothetical protein D6805_07570 [Planctomycetota bacterium]|nr:MAG: hypothetical protein D6805_07570 [Planctomycetota bacterium]
MNKSEQKSHSSFRVQMGCFSIFFLPFFLLKEVIFLLWSWVFPVSRDSQEGPLQGFVEFLLLLGFVTGIGSIFVIFSVLLAKVELLILAVILLLGAFLLPILSKRDRIKLERAFLLGSSVKIFNRLERYYSANEPKPLLFYILFPFSSVLYFVVSPEEAKKELSSYRVLISWIVGVVLFGSGLSYFYYYRYFGGDFTQSWLYLELLFVYFLCNLFAVPLATTSLSLSRRGKNGTIFFILLFSTLFLGKLYYTLSFKMGYSGYIATNIILDERISRSLQTLEGDSADTFLQDLQKVSQRFLKEYAPKVLDFNKRYYFYPRKVFQSYYGAVQKKFQNSLQKIARFGEHKEIYLMFTQDFDVLWAMVFSPFRDSILFLYRYDPKRGLKFYRSWKELPFSERRDLSRRWARGYQRESLLKHATQTITKYARDKFAQHRYAPKRSREEKSKSSNALERALGKVRSRVPESRRSSIAAKYNSYWRERAMVFRELSPTWREFQRLLTRQLHFKFSTSDFQAVEDLVKQWLRTWPKISKNFWNRAEEFASLYPRHLKQEREFIKSFRLYQDLKRRSEQAQRYYRQHGQYPSDYRKLRISYYQTSRRCHRLYYELLSNLDKIRGFDRSLQSFYQKLSVRLHIFYPPKVCFLPYWEKLRSFDYPRALKVGLVYDHRGKSPALRKRWRNYSKWLGYAIVAFELVMPLHILLIFYAAASSSKRSPVVQVVRVDRKGGRGKNRKRNLGGKGNFSSRTGRRGRQKFGARSQRKG